MTNEININSKLGFNEKNLKEDIKNNLFGIPPKVWDGLREEVKIELVILSQMDGELINHMLTYEYGEEAYNYYRTLLD